MATNVMAPMTGKIVRINVEPGETVAEDFEILVIEAMKMETPIYAPCDGMIEKILKKVGDEVEEDDVIALMA
ncbi:MAG: acetyl-CoA carboxylase biotin carboxyl carrier protein subunit [Proteobacteria bacterium]|nr:acetyl-CoA carboxylase biotin carboxyl carrier protein subunit [Desulfobacula sp.]MBU3952734.1 acetyl-CoA carboxylase biotin carboxyl carrier protein subunit [Pseudomonadota bacterium]MBU4132907.1 acetyl-CoA carboxylase biotin carboxyl carrier protein subunit [Pseudomonadota bacterium]